jgi:hypothetical protein
VHNSTSLEYCNRPVQGRKVLQKIAVQDHEVGKLAFRDCANLVDDPEIAGVGNPARWSTSIS